jgi:hypothetical protein
VCGTWTRKVLFLAAVLFAGMSALGAISWSFWPGTCLRGWDWVVLRSKDIAWDHIMLSVPRGWRLRSDSGTLVLMRVASRLPPDKGKQSEFSFSYITVWRARRSSRAVPATNAASYQERVFGRVHTLDYFEDLGVFVVFDGVAEDLPDLRHVLSSLRQLGPL